MDAEAGAEDSLRCTGLDTTVPHSARIWNYWLGGKDNFAVDRKVGGQLREVYPAIVDLARSDRRFLRRAVGYLTGGGTTSIVLGDLREPEAILDHPKTRALIGFTRPAGLLLVAVLHFIPDKMTRAGSWVSCVTRCRRAAFWRCRM